jgi:hypothetical protein
MAVTITERPQGHVLLPTPVLDNPQDSGGDLRFNISAGHGLSAGQLLYITSPADRYNGYKYVELINSTDFFIRDTPSGPNIKYIGRVVTVNYYKILLDHGWSCVHLPIVYKMESDLFPYASPVNTILSFANDGLGNTDITPTASLSGSFQILGFVRLEGTSVDGVYEILDNAGSLVIDLPYDAGYTMAGGTMAVYYPNYHIRVQIYGGLNSAHHWALEKPYELISTLKLIPDNNNEIQFSIANELKKHVKSLTNNLSLDTLPNNIDFFTMFYITTQESYDLSDGTEVTTFEGSIVSDKVNFEGFAVNAKLEFKNVHSGFLSDYLVDQLSQAAKFLTLFETPVMFSGFYFDISALLNFDNSIYYDLPSIELEKIWVDSNGDEQDPEYEEITNYDAGLYRLQIEPNCNYKQLKIQLQIGPFQETTNSEFQTNLSGWTQPLTEPANASWAWTNSFGGSAAAVLAGPVTAEDTKTILQTFNNYKRVRVRVEMECSYVDGGFPACSFNVVTFNGLTPAETLFTHTFTANLNNFALDFEVDAPLDYTQIGFWVENGFTIDPDNTPVFYVKYFIVDSILEALSEQKTIDIDCKCSNQNMELTWLNYLGGMEYWVFTAQKEHQIDIKESKTRLLNIFPTWPQSYGQNASTMRQETKRASCFRRTIRSQNISIDNLEAIKYIKTSSLVQIVVSEDLSSDNPQIVDLRTVLVDTDSFTVYNEGDKTFDISFSIEYTDYIPSQNL